MIAVLTGVIIDLLGTQLPHKLDFSTSFHGDGVGEMEIKRQKCRSRTSATKCWTISASPIVSTLIDMGRPSSLVVWPAAMCVCEQRWYSVSGRLNSQSAISTFSRGALMMWVTVDMESVRSLVIWFPFMPQICSFVYHERSFQQDQSFCYGVKFYLLGGTIIGLISWTILFRLC